MSFATSTGGCGVTKKGAVLVENANAADGFTLLTAEQAKVALRPKAKQQPSFPKRVI
jgi:hypothetical protein